jgi:hypothetical protein
MVRVGNALVLLPADSTEEGTVLTGPDARHAFRLHGRLTPEGPEFTPDSMPMLSPLALARAPGTKPEALLVLKGSGRKTFLCRMDLTGRLEPVATLNCALIHEGPTGEDRLDGTLDYVRFGQIFAITADPEGRILLADSWGTIRRIGAWSQVERLAGRPGEWLGRIDHSRVESSLDGRALDVEFGHLEAMALDPLTGNLYLAEDTRIRCLTPDGEVRTLLGGAPLRGMGQAALPGPWPLGRPCFRGIRAMALQGGRLIILDFDQLLAFDLMTRQLLTLAGPAPSKGAPVYGPFRPFSPGRAPAQCAQIPTVWAMAGGDQEVFLLFPFTGTQPARGVGPFASRIARAELPWAAFALLDPAPPAEGPVTLRIRADATHLRYDEACVLRPEWSDSRRRAVAWTLPDGFTREDLGEGVLRIKVRLTTPQRVVVRVAETSASSSDAAPRTAEMNLDILP